MYTYLTVLVLAASALGDEAIRNPLDDPRQEIRDAEALRLRSAFKPIPASKWDDLLVKLKTGISLEEVKKILGPASKALRLSYGYMNGDVYHHSLDECWLLQFEMGRFVPGLTHAGLVAFLETHYTNPPKAFTGTWRDYFVSGTLCRETDYRDGKRHGLDRMYNDNGTLDQIEAYVNGVEHGESIGYYPNKKLRFKGQYKHGKKAGTWIDYNEKGEVTFTERIKAAP